MKRFNLIFLIVLFVFLFSCVGKPKVKTPDNEQVKKVTAEQTDKLAEKINESAVKVQPPADLTATATEKPADTPTVPSAEKPAEEQLNEKTAQADSSKDIIADAASTNKTEPATASSQTQPQTQTQTQTQPQAQAQSQTQTQPQAQTQPQTQAQPQPQAQPQTQAQPQPQAQPQAQTQPQPQAQPQAQQQQQALPQTQTPQSNQPAPSQTQPPTDGNTDASKTASSDDDSQSAKEPSPFITGGNSAPATRIESLTQMGTVPQDKEIIYSRIVHATVGQIVEIPFRGNGWVYLGELTSRRGIVFSSRRIDADGQSFIFTLEEAGTYALKFYRQDFIKDYIINDHVQVVVGEAPSAGVGWFNPPTERDRVVAQPRWPSSIEETQIRNGTRPVSEPVVTMAAEPAKDAPQQKTASDQETRAPQRTTPANRTPSQNTPSSSAASGQTAQSGQTAASQTAQPAQTSQTGQTAATAQTAQPAVTTAEQSGNDSAQKIEKLTPEASLKKAKETYDGGNIASAIALLEQSMADYPDGSDEVYWQLGQYYETNSPSRNILRSLDYYRRLVNEYPQSGRFNDAKRRIAYLERYYINIQ